MLGKAKVKYIQSLGQKKHRDSEERFVAEGPKIVEELLKEVPGLVEEVFALPEWIGMQKGKSIQALITEVEKADLERISKTDLMPAYFKRLQFKTDSLRAIDWFQKTKDSSYLEKYTHLEEVPFEPMEEKLPQRKSREEELLAILPDEKQFRHLYQQFSS